MAFDNFIKLCRSATALKTSLYRWCFLINFAKFVKCEIRLLLIITVSVVVKG